MTPTPFTVRRLRFFTVRKNGVLAFYSRQPQNRVMSYRETFHRRTSATPKGTAVGNLKILTPSRYGFTS